MESNQVSNNLPLWMIYGAYGYTGKLLVEEACNKGLHPILGGRNEEKLIELANQYNLDYRVFSLDEIAEIKKNLNDIKLLFNAAGPYVNTAEVLISSCLDIKCNYLDITGEITVFEQNFTRHDEAIKNDIAIISGVGFDVVPSDCLINYVSKKIENPIELEIGVLALSKYSPGTMKSVITHLPNGSVIRKDGKIVPIKIGSKCKSIRFIEKETKMCAIAWGDIATAYRSTGIPNITTYLKLPSKLIKMQKIFGFIIRNLFKLGFVQKIAKKWVEKNIKGPDEELRLTAKSELWAQVKNEKGESAQAWLQTIEAYRLTAITGIKAVEKVFQERIVGALTPAQAFGEDFVLEIPDTHRFDSL